MKFVAIVRPPARPDEAVRTVVAATGLTLAEARMRLAPEPPAILARLEPERAEALSASLVRGGLAAIALEAKVPTDADRTLARNVTLGEASAVFTPRAGAPMEVAWTDVLAILRGVRASRSETEQIEKKKQFSVGMAVATGGLKMTRTTSTSVRSSQEAIEQVILVYARDGRAALLSEALIDFGCLGSALQPSRTANMVAVGQALRERVNHAGGQVVYDERLLRLGRRPLPFVTSMEERVQAPSSVVTRTNTAGTFDVLAEILRQAITRGMLP